MTIYIFYSEHTPFTSVQDNPLSTTGAIDASQSTSFAAPVPPTISDEFPLPQKLEVRRVPKYVQLIMCMQML